MTAAELLKLKWGVALLITGRADDARNELLELLAAATSPIERPDLLQTREIDLRLKDGAPR